MNTERHFSDLELLFHSGLVNVLSSNTDDESLDVIDQYLLLMSDLHLEAYFVSSAMNSLPPPVSSIHSALLIVEDEELRKMVRVARPDLAAPARSNADVQMTQELPKSHKIIGIVEI